MKRVGRKGFTLIELLAVIVVLAIILVITVPMILNSISTTRQESLQASADTAAKYYTNQLGMAFLGVKQNGFVVDAMLESNGKLKTQPYRCITKEEADILGLNTEDYSINESCTGTVSLPETCYSNTLDYSIVKWDEDGNATVKLVGKTGGKFVSGSNVLVATSNESTTTSTNFDSSENITLSNTTAGKTIKNLKIYGNTENGVSVGEKTKNLFEYNNIEQGTMADASGSLSESNYRVRTKDFISLDAGSYTISSDDVYIRTIHVYDFETEEREKYLWVTKKNYSFTLSEKKKIKIVFQYASDSSIQISTENVINSNVMLTNSNSNNNSEQSDYPISITVSGKNLSNFNPIIDNNILVDNSDNTYNLVYSNTGRFTSKFDINIPANTPFTISLDILEFTVSHNYVFNVEYKLADGTVKYSNFYKNTKSLTHTFTSDVKQIRFYQQATGDVGSYTKFKNLMINLGDIASSYEPYIEPITYTINLSAPLRSNGSTRDYIDFELGKVIRWIDSDGNILSNPKEENVSLPDIKTISGTTILTSDTVIKSLISGSY